MWHHTLLAKALFIQGRLCKAVLSVVWYAVMFLMYKLEMVLPHGSRGMAYLSV